MEHTELETAIASINLAETLPIALPLAHITPNRPANEKGFEDILGSGRLNPQYCTVFGSNLLYFSYGGLFYSKRHLQTQQVAELPVGLVFDPGALALVSQLFPFDSGAMSRGNFGVHWSEQFTGFQTRFVLNANGAERAMTAARQLVYLLFVSNDRYIWGRPREKPINDHAALDLLCKFLNADLSGTGADHRQRTIEAISKMPVELGKHLLWIGCPRIDTVSRKKKLFEWTKPRVVPMYEYDWPANFDPAQIAHELQDHAHTDVIREYVNFPE